jgi:hypothetical protein
MTNPRTIMIDELATTENFLVIKELVELWPEIIIGHHKKLFEDAFAVEEIWKGYKINGVPSKQLLEVVIPSNVGRNLFRFIIGVSDSDKNWWFGIKGPWDLSTKHPEIVTLKDACIQHKLHPYSDYMYGYFDSQRSDVYGLLSQKADVKSILISMVKQFHLKCNPLKDQVERLNDILVTG